MTELVDSGIEWLGLIPSHWKIIKLKFIGTCRNGLTYSPNDVVDKGEGTLILRSSNIQNGKLFFDDNVYLKNGSENFLVKQGDIIICSRNGSRELVGKNALIDSELKAYFGAFMLLFRCDSPRYIYYVFNSGMFNYYLSSFFTTTINQLTIGNFNNMVVPLPPPNEQKKIVDFLDAKCAAIDLALDNAKKLVEKMRDYKKSLITEVVTKGLNPAAELKDSGIDWLGLIPSHWKVGRLKFYLKKPLQYGANSSGVDFDENLPRYIRITDIISVKNLKSVGKLSLDFEDATQYLLENEDILFARSGATVGKTFMYSSEVGQAAFAGYLIRAKINQEKLLPRFFIFFTQSFSYDEWKNQIFIQATIQNIGAEKYNNLKFPVPPLEEQKKIVDFLDAKCAAIDEQISQRQKLIEKLTEYKKALIYEVVTGKKEV